MPRKKSIPTDSVISYNRILNSRLSLDWFLPYFNSLVNFYILSAPLINLYKLTIYFDIFINFCTAYCGFAR